MSSWSGPGHGPELARLYGSGKEKTTATIAQNCVSWKNESARLVAVLVRILRDVGLAEDMAHDALVAALEEGPRSGLPERP